MTNAEKQRSSPSPDLRAYTTLTTTTESQGEPGKEVRGCGEAEGKGSFMPNAESEGK